MLLSLNELARLTIKCDDIKDFWFAICSRFSHQINRLHRKSFVYQCTLHSVITIFKAKPKFLPLTNNELLTFPVLIYCLERVVEGLNEFLEETQGHDRCYCKLMKNYWIHRSFWPQLQLVVCFVISFYFSKFLFSIFYFLKFVVCSVKLILFAGRRVNVLLDDVVWSSGGVILAFGADIIIKLGWCWTEWSLVNLVQAAGIFEICKLKIFFDIFCEKGMANASKLGATEVHLLQVRCVCHSNNSSSRFVKFGISSKLRWSKYISKKVFFGILFTFASFFAENLANAS